MLLLRFVCQYLDIEDILTLRSVCTVLRDECNCTEKILYQPKSGQSAQTLSRLFQRLKSISLVAVENAPPDLYGVDSLSLVELELKGVRSLSPIAETPFYSSIRYLDIECIDPSGMYGIICQICSRFPNLLELRLNGSGCTELSEQSLSVVLSRQRELRTFKLANAAFIQSIECKDELRDLRRVEIVRCCSFSNISLSLCQHLEYLNVSYTQVDCSSLEQMVQAAPQLQTLRATHCFSLSGPLQLVSSNVQDVDFRMCTALTEITMSSMRVRHVLLSGCFALRQVQYRSSGKKPSLISNSFFFQQALMPLSSQFISVSCVPFS